MKWSTLTKELGEGTVQVLHIVFWSVIINSAIFAVLFNYADLSAFRYMGF